MSTPFMPESHRQAEPRPAARPWEWPLAPGEVRRIEAAPVQRWLDVAAGRVWLTPTREDDLADDHWLAAGERLALPAGSAWVVEAWPSARVALHEAAPCAA
ncbi:MAG: DUF2917 domain-containing protein [Rubrivivax sp.]